MARYVVLFRGINVGGRHKVPMADLRALFDAAGATNVRSYIQSGNVVYEAPERVAPLVPDRVERELERRFGFRAPLVVRTRDEIAGILAHNPYLRPDSDHARLHVVFLSQAPADGAVLDPHRSPGDEFTLAGREIYLWLPNGAADTKLTNAYFDSVLGVVSTVRNWRTVRTLFDMLATDD